MIVEDQRAVSDELRAIDRRIADIDKQLSHPQPAGVAVASRLFAGGRAIGGGHTSYEAQEFAVERRQLFALRRDIESDQTRPVTRDGDGNPLDVRSRLIRRGRAANLRDQAWREAERARAEGDHRRARQLRFDALRARHLAETELGWRPQVHYG
jgi:hypothetical protein